MSLLEAQGLVFNADDRALIRDVSLSLESHSLTILVGPNGAGKTTLLRLALGLIKPQQGKVSIEGVDLVDLSAVQRARKASYLPQQRALVWPQNVRDVVALGRFAYGAAPGRLSAADESAVREAMVACDLNGFEDRSADRLSGGELARVHLARALCSQTSLLIADEPVAALDPRYRHEVLRIFAQAAKDGRCVLTVVHDLVLAARYADRLIWMQDGQIVADGPPADTVTQERMRTVFGVEANVSPTQTGSVALDIVGPA